MTLILVADDVDENRYMLVSLFRGVGFEVATASDGAAALQLARSSPPDIIVTDIMMPVMDGFELCRHWKRDEALKQIPFLVYTATYTDPADERLALSLGADRFLVKPQRPDVIVQAVHELLDAIDRNQVAIRAPVVMEAQLVAEHAQALTRKLTKREDELEHEIAQRRTLEGGLRESTALLRIAGRMARLGGFVVDLRERRVRWSDEVASILGFPPGTTLHLEEATGLFTPEFQARISRVIDACAREGAPFDEEMEVVTTGGAHVWVRTLGEAVRDESGDVVSIQGALQDITDRREAEEEHRRIQSQLLQAQKMESIGRLASGVAHDFNNLLFVVLNYSCLAIDALPQGDPLRAQLDEVRKAGERAAALTRQLLAISRKQILQPAVIDLNRVVLGIHEMLRRILGEDIGVEVQLSGDAGPVLADPGQIEQVIMNLAVNARDAMPSGGKLIIETSDRVLDEDEAARHLGRRRGRFSVLSVRDTGCGMDRATLEHIFEPFFTTKENGKGTGLGLSTVYGIVEQSGGSIRVESEPGHGTTIEVYLPRVETKVTVATQSSGPALATGHETIMVVEDEEAVRQVAQRILASAGYEVSATANGKEALELFERRRGAFDLLLTDVVMPEMGGRELAGHLTALKPGLKVLYMSGYTEDAMLQSRALEPGTRFICKPFSAAELWRKVRELLDEALDI